MNVIEVEGLRKSYGKVKALDGISFGVEESTIFGFIGPDGSGKTTLFRILTTLIVPDSGAAAVLGMDTVKDYKKIRRKLGYMPGRFSLYQDLTVEENLSFFASIFDTTIEENYELIKDIYIQIEPFKNRRAGKLSGGMKQKLALSCALIHKPEVLILDEPTTGVDAVSRREFWEMLANLKKAGITIVVSTPYMDEAGKCDTIALIQNGSIMRIDTPDAIVNNFDKLLYAINSSKKFKLLRALQSFGDTASVYPFGDSFHYTSKSQIPDTSKLIKYLSSCGIDDAEIKRINPGIEDTFMELMTKV